MNRLVPVAVTAFCTLTLLAGCGGPTSIYKAGTYTATAEGYGGDLVVEVEIDKESILSVQVITHKGTDWFAEKAIPAVQDEMMEKQTWEVDAVTSATMTSEAIKAAVKDCMERAGTK